MPIISPEVFDYYQRLVAAESADQPEEGQFAAAATVLNRMASPQFPSSFYDVATQKGQFEPWRKYGSFENMPSLTQPQQDRLRGFTNNYSAETDPTGGALYFQNPSITAQRGTKFGQPNAVTIGDQTFSRTYGNEPMPTTPPIYANNAPQPQLSPLEQAKQSIFNLTTGQNSEAAGKELLNSGSPDMIIQAAAKMQEMLGNLGHSSTDAFLSAERGNATPSMGNSYQTASAPTGGGSMQQSPQYGGGSAPIAYQPQTSQGGLTSSPKPQRNPTVYSGAPVVKDADGKFHHKSIGDFFKYIGTKEKYRPKAVKGDGKEYVTKIDLDKDKK